MKVGQRGWSIFRIERVILDASPLGQLSQQRPPPPIRQWLADLAASGATVFIAEVADYEVRRNLLLHRLPSSLQALDDLRRKFTFAPITTPIMLRAAEFWAQARQKGKPTAGAKELDCDMILSATAVEHHATIATDNLRHLALFADARRWQDIRP